jgi:hypothetical protein
MNLFSNWKLQTANCKLVLSIVYCLVSIVSFAQNETVYRVGLILPFETEQSISKLDAYASAHDFFTASKVSLPADAIASLDFYQGVVQSLTEKGNVKIELSLYDNQNDDSTTRELLKKGELRKLE